MEEIHYLLGNSCDLDCDFCLWDIKMPDPDFQTKMQIMDAIAETGIKRVTLSGGEPTINRHFFPVLEYMQEKGLETIVHTNGYSLDRLGVGKMAPLVSRVSLSIDAIDLNSQKIMRKKEEITFRNLCLIDSLISYRVPFNVKTLVTKVNQDQIWEIGEMLNFLSAEYWSLLEFNPLNRGSRFADKFSISPEDFDLAVEEAKKVYYGKIRPRRLKDSRKDYCFIAPNGNVYSYNGGPEDILIGNLRSEKLSYLIEKINSS